MIQHITLNQPTPHRAHANQVPSIMKPLQLDL